jgi:hypothetical protein
MYKVDGTHRCMSSPLLRVEQKDDSDMLTVLDRGGGRLRHVSCWTRWDGTHRCMISAAGLSDWTLRPRPTLTQAFPAEPDFGAGL